MIEFECDDALATAAARFAALPAVERVVICSPDKDLTQCVRGDRVVCFDRMRRKLLDERGVVEKFGVAPTSIPDWLALVGDSADGYPGIPRWGAKSAAAVLGAVRKHRGDPRRRGAVERAGARRGGARRELGRASRRRVSFRQLATLRTDVPLVESLDDLRWRGADAAALAALAKQWDDGAIVERAARLARG